MALIDNVAVARVSVVCSTESNNPSGNPWISSVDILDLYTHPHAKHYFLNDSQSTVFSSSFISSWAIDAPTANYVSLNL